MRQNGGKMSRFKKNMASRILAYLLSGAMIMSNMTAYASEPSDNTGGGYYEEAADSESTDTGYAEEAEADDASKDAEYNEDEKDDVKEASEETVGATETTDGEAEETQTSKEEQTSETESSLSADTETTEAEETSEEETETEVEKKTKEKNNKAAEDKTYTSTYNFGDKSIVSENTDGIGPEVSADGKLTVSSSTEEKTYRYNDAQHGVEFKPGSQIKIHVLGNVKVFIGGCQYSGTGNGSASILTVTNGSTEVYKCEDTKSTCTSTDGISFEYTGDEADLIMAFSGEGSTYVPVIKVERTEPAVLAKVTLADENNVLQAGDTIKLVNQDDADDAYDITSATTETEFQLRANATYNIVSSNKKIKATSNNETTITTETAPITVTVTLEADESTDQGPTKTYTSTYDFRDGTGVPTSGENETMSEDKKLTITGNYTYNGAQHGSIFKTGNTIKIHVLGKAKVFIGGCQFSKGSLKVTSGNDIIQTFDSTKTTACYHNDATAGLLFNYDGDETDLVLTFDTAETYVPIITVERTEPVEMITYTSTYDFRDGTGVPTSGENETTSEDKKLTITGNYTHNGAQHGSIFKTGNTIKIHVLGKAKVFIGGCQFSKGSLEVTSGNDTIQTFDSTKTTACYHNDATAGLLFDYDGDETDLILTFDTAETYVPIITVERTEPKPDEVKATVTINDENELLQDGDTIKLVNTNDETDEIDITGAVAQPMELTLPGNTVYNIVSSNSDIAAAFEGRTTVTTTTEDISVIIDLTATVVNPTVTISGADAVTGDYKLTLTNESDSEDTCELKDGETVKLKIGGTYKLESSNAEVEAKINGTILLIVTADLTAITVEVSAPDTTHHTYDVWDFGAEVLENTGNITYNNQLTADMINAWYPGIAPGSQITSDNALTTDGEELDTGTGLKLISNGNKKKWRLRGLSENKTITSEQNESSLTDEFGKPYQGIMYDNAGSGKIWMTLEVKAGDKVSAVVSSNGTASTITWESPSGKDVQTFEFTRGSRTKLANTTVFTAAEDGAYKLYTPNEKLVVARIYRERPNTVTVSGKVTFPEGASWANDSELIFTNRATGAQTKATVIAGAETTYTVKLHEQYGYDVSVEGVESCIVGANNKLTLANEAGDTAFDVELMKVELVEVTGSLADLTPEAAAKVKIAFKNDEKVYVPKITINTEQVTYTGKFEKGVEYAVEESNVNDYTLETKTLKTDEAGAIDIRFTKKPVYAINVTLEGPTAEEAAQTKLTFTNIDEEGYEYEFTGTQGIELRDGQYAVKAVLEGYTQKVTSDVKVSGAAVDKTIVMVRNSSQEVAYKETITVGSDNTYDYQSINDALEAVRNMKRENGERVTISIAPGDYEEMLVVDTPNVTLKNASVNPSTALKNKGVDIDENAVRITSYYGHGYTYYSMGDNCKWDADVLDANKENGYPSYKNPGSGTTNGSYWNATVVISAGGFQAEGIIFENSFNQYVSKKAAEDIIVKQSGAKEGASPRADMKYGDVTVQQKEYVERAAALAIYQNVSQTYFENCKFIGRQDTLYGGVNSTVAFYKCSVYGGTDYIFGGMKAVFAKCDLVFNTNDQTDKGKKDDVGYITAAQQKSGRGYLMYNCHVTSTTPGVDTASEHTSKPGYLGRPWEGKTGEAVFFYTVIDEADAFWQESFGKSLIRPVGWDSSLGGESALSQEFGTYEKAADVNNLEARASWAQVLSEPKIDGKPITVAKFIGKWNPFEGKDMTIEAGDTKLDEPHDENDWKADAAFKTMPVLKKSDSDTITELCVGDVLTLAYELELENGEEDASVIGWYRVTGNAEVPLNASGNTYTVTPDDIGSKIKVMVTPATSTGRTGEAASYTIDAVVKLDAPVASIPTGTTVEPGTAVTLTCATEVAEIFYTTDGTEPTAESNKYTGEIIIADTMTIKAIAIMGKNKSEISTFEYTVSSDKPIVVTTININDCEIAVSSILADSKKNPDNMPKTSVVYYVGKDRKGIPVRFAEGLDYKVSKPVLKEGNLYAVTLTGLGRSVDEYRIDPDSSCEMTFRVFDKKADKNSIIDLSKAKITLDGTQKGAIYTGKAFTPEVKEVKVGKDVIDMSKYKVSYKSNVNAGKASVIVSADSKAMYGEGEKFVIGTKAVTFTIKKAALNKADQITVTALDKDGKDFTNGSFPYRGIDVVEIDDLSVKTTSGQKNLREGIDYTVTYKNNRKVGKASAVIKGIGNNVSGSYTVPFKIEALNIGVDSQYKLRLVEGVSLQYTPNGAKLRLVCAYNEDDRIYLEEGIDFKVTYKYFDKSKAPGTDVDFTAKGINACTGYFSNKVDGEGNSFKIEKASLGKSFYLKADVIVDAAKATDSNKLQKAVEKALVLVDPYDGKLKVKKDYTVEVNEKDKKVLIRPAEKSYYLDADYVEDPYLQTDYTLATNIKTVKPDKKYTVSYDGRNPVQLDKDDISKLLGGLKLNEDVVIVKGSYKNNYKAGTASVTVQGIGNYYGTVTIKFKIIEA
ncbi:hypothetical protein FMM75_06635 [Lachnospiraceae bacterium MD335]|nr:hypothetical protein [Lachnospiraceae bacterium MD335]